MFHYASSRNRDYKLLSYSDAGNVFELFVFRREGMGSSLDKIDQKYHYVVNHSKTNGDSVSST